MNLQVAAFAAFAVVAAGSATAVSGSLRRAYSVGLLTDLLSPQQGVTRIALSQQA